MISTRAARAAVWLTLAVAGCGTILGVGELGPALELAVDCKTDEALRATDAVAAKGGVARSVALQEKVAILRDAGRTSEAGALEQELLTESPEPDLDEFNDAIDEVVQKLREDRQKRIGRPTCGNEGPRKNREAAA